MFLCFSAFQQHSCRFPSYTGEEVQHLGAFVKEILSTQCIFFSALT